MPSTAQTVRVGRLALLVGGALLTLISTTPAASAGCGEVTIKHIQVASQRPASCIAVQLQHAIVLLDKALVDAHAKGLVAAHPDDEHSSWWSARRAGALLQNMTSRTTLDSCARVDGTRSTGDWLRYVALQIDQGWAAVQPSGSNTLVSTVAVRERSMDCPSGSIGGTSTRMYGIPGGHWFLPLLTGIS
ncbi:hypothetical protein [Roseateles sp. P5_E1]